MNDAHAAPEANVQEEEFADLANDQAIRVQPVEDARARQLYAADSQPGGSVDKNEVRKFITVVCTADPSSLRLQKNDGHIVVSAINNVAIFSRVSVGDIVHAIAGRTVPQSFTAEKAKRTISRAIKHHATCRLDFKRACGKQGVRKKTHADLKARLPEGWCIKRRRCGTYTRNVFISPCGRSFESMERVSAFLAAPDAVQTAVRRLRLMRNQKNHENVKISLAMFAKKLGAHRTTVSAWMNGRGIPTAAQCVIVARCWGDWPVFTVPSDHKTYVCATCKKSFAYKYSLQTHMRLGICTKRNKACDEALGGVQSLGVSDDDGDGEKPPSSSRKRKCWCC